LNYRRPLFVIGKEKQKVVSELEKHNGGRYHLVLGTRNYAAKAGDIFAAWGLIPSPLSQRAVEWFLRLYRDETYRSRRIFYCCYAGTHTSVVACALHLGMLKVTKLGDGKRPSEISGEISQLPYFDRRTTDEIGVPIFMGKDVYGSEVYAMGTGWLYHTLETVLCDIIEVANPKASACFCNVRSFLDFSAKIGGFLSRRFSVVSPGRKLIARSLSKKLPQIQEAVKYCLDLSARWNDNEKQPGGEVIRVDGSKPRRISGSGAP